MPRLWPCALGHGNGSLLPLLFRRHCQGSCRDPGYVALGMMSKPGASLAFGAQTWSICGLASRRISPRDRVCVVPENAGCMEISGSGRLSRCRKCEWEEGKLELMHPNGWCRRQGSQGLSDQLRDRLRDHYVTEEQTRLNERIRIRRLSEDQQAQEDLDSLLAMDPNPHNAA